MSFVSDIDAFAHLASGHAAGAFSSKTLKRTAFAITSVGR